MTMRDVSDCASIEEVESRIMSKIDGSLAECDAEEIATLRERGATQQELIDFASWRKETTRRWREATARRLSLFLRDADFGGEIH